MKYLKGLLIFAAFLGVFSLWQWEEKQHPSAIFLTWKRDPTTTMAIQWHWQNHSETTIFYRKMGENEWKKQTGISQKIEKGSLFGDFFIHSVELLNLCSDTSYEFYIENNAKIYRFRTMPEKNERPVRFVVGGDVYQDDLRSFKRMNSHVARCNPDFVVLGGDIAYTSKHGFIFRGPFFEIQRWRSFFKAWQNQLVASDGRLIPMVVVIGNHDTDAKSSFFNDLFFMPGSVYRALDFGNYLSLLLLDTGHISPIAGEQLQWLEKALIERAAFTHKMAVYHIGAYPSVHSFNAGKHKEVRKRWSPLFERYHVKTAFEHHDHTYKRTYPIKEEKIDPEGVRYLGDGGWGAMVRQPRNADKLWYVEKSAQVNFVYLVTLKGAQGKIQAIDIDGHIFDSFEVLR